MNSRRVIAVYSGLRIGNGSLFPSVLRLPRRREVGVHGEARREQAQAGHGDQTRLGEALRGKRLQRLGRQQGLALGSRDRRRPWRASTPARPDR